MTALLRNRHRIRMVCRMEKAILFRNGYVADCRKKYFEIMKTIIAFLSLFCYTILGQTRVSGRIILAGEVAVPCTCNPL